MNKTEMFDLLKQGHKMSHCNFSPNEFIVMKDGELFDETGQMLPWGDFWSFRNARHFELGWEKYDTDPTYTIFSDRYPGFTVKVTNKSSAPLPAVRPTGAMPGLEWLLNLFKRKKKTGFRALSRKERMEEYYKDSGCFD